MIDFIFSMIRIVISVWIISYGIKFIRMSDAWKVAWIYFTLGTVFWLISRIALIHFTPCDNTFPDMVFTNVVPTIGNIFFILFVRKVYRIFNGYQKRIK